MQILTANSVNIEIPVIFISKTIYVELIFALVQAIVTAILGAILKEKVVPSRFVPIQNLVIGLISAGIAVYFDLFVNVPMAIVTCLAISLGVGGGYDALQAKNK